MRTAVQVVYKIPVRCPLRVDSQLDEQIESALTRAGFVRYGKGLDLQTGKRDICFYAPRPVYLLKKELPGLSIGARFQQTHQSDNVYFHAIPVDASKTGKDQVGIIEFEARYVEDNPEWFELLIE